VSQPSAPIPEPIRHALAAEDPFEAFDHGMGMYAVREPFSRFERQRRRGALLETDLADTYPPYIPRGEDTRGWLVLSYRLATRVARDAASFSSAQYAATADAVMGKNLLSMDPPQHTRYRNLVNQTFAPSAIATWERELVRPIIRDTLAGFAQRGRADLTREYSFHFPVRIIAALFGMPDACLPDFHRLSVELQCVLFDYERGLGAARKVTEMFREVIEEHRREPRPDLLTALLEVELEGERLSEEEILGFMRLLLPAGLETTYRGAGNVLFSLLSHPEQLDAVRANRRLLDQAVEEALRWQPILTGSLRFTTRDTELERCMSAGRPPTAIPSAGMIRRASTSFATTSPT
jgi:cytochrome P450